MDDLKPRLIDTSSLATIPNSIPVASTRIEVRSGWSRFWGNMKLWHVLEAPFHQPKPRWVHVINVLVYVGVCCFPVYFFYWLQNRTRWPIINVRHMYALTLLVCAICQVLYHLTHLYKVIPKVQAEEKAKAAQLATLEGRIQAIQAGSEIPQVPSAESESEGKSRGGGCMGTIWGIAILSILPVIIYTATDDCPYSACLYYKDFPQPEDGGTWTEQSCLDAHPLHAHWCEYIPAGTDAKYTTTICQCFRVFYGKKYIGLTPVIAFVLGVLLWQPITIMVMTLLNKKPGGDLPQEAQGEVVTVQIP